MPPEPSGYLFDLDGTLYIGAEPVPGAAAAIERLRRRRVPFRFVSNTTSRPRGALAERLRRLGIEAEPRWIHTPLVAAAELLAERGHRVIAPFTPVAALGDLGSVALAGGVSDHPPAANPDAVLIGDLGEQWTYALLQEAFDYVLGGATLIALSRDRYFRRGDRLAIDAGPFVAALEYATGGEAELVGKPSKAFFGGAAASLGLAEVSKSIVMVGDDLWSDIRGAQEAGLAGWLVRTGKYRADALEISGVVPDRILYSVAEVAAEGGAG
ncbi:MAG TPA: TIGR01458 family HAD-type hydrolase [Gemmatimonadales bacterium]|jgi:HAD superfamily hydrolase (TIGR01458 family)|nr:TIGR01458 family HAD-type hydrolase [Gemmatimonadales bacterium]